MTTLFTHEQHLKFSKVTLRSTVNGKPYTVIDVSNVSSGVHAQLPSCNSSIVPKFGFHTSDAILKKVTHTCVFSYAHYTYSDKADVIELINGCIYSVLVLFILWHISILILTFVFFSLDFCFNSIRKRQNNQKVHCQSTSPFGLIEMLIPDKIFHSDTNFFCLMTVIITLPYFLGVCCHYHDESKQVMTRITSELIALFQTVSKQWSISGKPNLTSVWYAIDSMKLLSALSFLKAKTEIQLLYFSYSSYYDVSENLLLVCPMTVVNLITSQKFICQMMLAGCFLVMSLIRNDLIFRLLPSWKIFLLFRYLNNEVLVTVGCFLFGPKSYLSLNLAQFVLTSLITFNLLSLLIPRHFLKTLPLSVSHELIVIFCIASVFSENPFFFYLMSDHKILVIVALLFAWLLSIFIKFGKFGKFSNFCILYNHSKSCLLRRKKYKHKYMQVKFPHALKRNRKKKQQESVKLQKRIKNLE